MKKDETTNMSDEAMIEELCSIWIRSLTRVYTV